MVGLFGCSDDSSRIMPNQNSHLSQADTSLSNEFSFYMGKWNDLIHLKSTPVHITHAPQSYSYHGTIPCLNHSFPFAVFWVKDGEYIYDCYAGAEGLVEDKDMGTAYKLVFFSSEVVGIHGGIIRFIIKCNYFTYYNWEGEGGNPNYHLAQHVVYELAFDTAAQNYTLVTHIENGRLEPDFD